MSETKQEMRIVSKARYRVVMGKKIGLLSVAALAAGLGGMSCLLMCLSAIWMVVGVGEWEVATSSYGFISTCLFGGITWGAFRFNKKLYDFAEAIEPVEPITDRNAHLAPLEDTLVRASDLPPTVQQAELLRAVRTGQETPPEQLLRAEQGRVTAS